MELFEAIANRHSYRGPYRYQDIPRHNLKRIVEAGMAAPSGRNYQTTEFVIIDDKDILRTIGGLKDAVRSLQEARAVIACVIDRQPSAIALGQTYEIEDCAAATENMLLAATAFGYASVWLDGWLRRDDHADIVGSLIGLPDYKIVRVLLPIGIPAEPLAPPPKKTFDQRAWFNSYENHEA